MQTHKQMNIQRMSIQRMVIQTKLTPPLPAQHTLARTRLTQRLLQARNYRLTIVQAGAGYGKSTALAALASQDIPLLWYHLDREDAEPIRFLLYVLQGLTQTLPDFSQTPLALWEQWEQTTRPFPGELIIDTLTNELSRHSEEIFFVMDDAHMVNNTAVTCNLLSRLINHAPSNLHVLLSTRYPMQLEQLVTWRLRGNLLEISQAELAFTPAEINLLYAQQYELPLTSDQSQLLASKSEGWPMVLPLVRQNIQFGHAASVPDALEQLSGSASDLFTFLGQEVLEQQPEAVQRFLRETAVLDQLTPQLCDCIRGQKNSAEIIAYLQANGLFVTGIGTTTAESGVRYHHLFRDLLRNQLSQKTLCVLHQQAADCYFAQDAIETAVAHYIAAQNYVAAAEILAQHGRRFVAGGQLDMLAGHIGSFPPDILLQYPALFVHLGDVARLHSRFDAALRWYQQAEERFRTLEDLPGLGQALRGQARIYLDTVNPAAAEKLLTEALRISDGQPDRASRARLLDLLAENLINQGRMGAAQEFRQEADTLRKQESDEVAMPLRLMLRTGRLAKAKRRLEAMAAAESEQPVMQPRAHRETLLLLALIYAFFGEQEMALTTAVAGTSRGETLDAPFITAVGWMRQGHAWLLLKNQDGYQQAAMAFQHAIQISEEIQASRLKVEAYWGLCQAHGFRGQLSQAESLAADGVTLAQQAGDEWVTACIYTTLGAAYLLGERYDQAATSLNQASASFLACSDTHGTAVVLLWRCLLWHKINDVARLQRDIDDLLQLVRDHDYTFLFTHKTLLGPPQPRSLIPLLLYARNHNSHYTAFASSLLDTLGLSQLEFHPGYQLRVQTLGPFRLWHDAVEIPAKAWQRKKARQLFQLFLTYRRTTLHREQIVEMLWPELDPENAQRDFKIAYNVLCRVLEPDRPRNTPSAYILRDGSRYGLRPGADMWFDTAVFDQLITTADQLLHHNPTAAGEHYQRALALYMGAYLQEYPYEEWANQERTRLNNRYIRAAERLARALLQANETEKAIEVCQELLSQDNCWEPAYQILIRAHTQTGNHTQAIRIYHQCVENLQHELGVNPSLETISLYQELLLSN